VTEFNVHKNKSTLLREIQHT